MASDDNVTTLMIQPTPVGQTNFLKKEADLKPLLKKLSAASAEAVDVILEIMRSTNDLKLKKECAASLLQFNITVAKDTNADHLMRLVAHSRSNGTLTGNGNTKQLINAPDQEQRKPIVDFNCIRSLD